jgi:hypothetical protein
VDRVIQDTGISESSGLTTSPQHAKVLWTFNDSGGDASIFAIGSDGQTKAQVTIEKARAYDWEAIASLPGPGGTPMMAIGDIGDNAKARKSIEVIVIPEPKKLEDVSVRPTTTLRLTYPEGRKVDAETLLADQRSGRLYVVTKEDSGKVYSVPASVWPGTENMASGASVSKDGEAKSAAPVREGQLELAAGVEMPYATDGAMLPDGRTAVRTGNKLIVLPQTGEWPSKGTVRTLATVRLPEQPQGESLTVSGSDFLVGSEGVRQPVLRVDVPATAGTVKAPAPVTGTTTVEKTTPPATPNTAGAVSSTQAPTVVTPTTDQKTVVKEGTKPATKPARSGFRAWLSKHWKKWFQRDR